jgi:hypothetical protein
MISREVAEEQADLCFMYHAGAYTATVAALALTGNRSTMSVASAWGLGVIAHAALLYAVPQAREQILFWTARRMEEQKVAQHSADSALSRLLSENPAVEPTA